MDAHPSHESSHGETIVAPKGCPLPCSLGPRSDLRLHATGSAGKTGTFALPVEHRVFRPVSVSQRGSRVPTFLDTDVPCE